MQLASWSSLTLYPVRLLTTFCKSFCARCSWYETWSRAWIVNTYLSSKSHAMLSGSLCLRDSGDIVLENVEMCAVLLAACCMQWPSAPSLSAAVRPSSFLFPFADPISSLWAAGRAIDARNPISPREGTRRPNKLDFYIYSSTYQDTWNDLFF